MSTRYARALALAACCAGGASACRRDDEALRAAVQQLALAEGDEALRQVERVAARGRRALPPIEAALHTADVGGRKTLVALLRRLEEADAIPLLMHVAAYDPEEVVRARAESTLRAWSAGAGTRQERARTALGRLTELRAVGE